MLALTIIMALAHMSAAYYTLRGDKPPEGLMISVRLLTAAWVVAAIIR